MIQLELNISNMEKLAATFAAAPQKATVEFGRALEIAVVHMTNQAIREAPVGQYQGGTLKQGIGYKKTGPLEMTFFSNAKYSGYVNFDTRPHIITIVNKKVLANRRTGQFFGKVVHHPGTKAQPFFSDAIADGEVELTELLQTAMTNILS